MSRKRKVDPDEPQRPVPERRWSTRAHHFFLHQQVVTQLVFDQIPVHGLCQMVMSFAQVYECVLAKEPYFTYDAAKNQWTRDLSRFYDTPPPMQSVVRPVVMHMYAWDALDTNVPQISTAQPLEPATPAQSSSTTVPVDDQDVEIEVDSILEYQEALHRSLHYPLLNEYGDFCFTNSYEPQQSPEQSHDSKLASTAPPGYTHFLSEVQRQSRLETPGHLEQLRPVIRIWFDSTQPNKEKIIDVDDTYPLSDEAPHGQPLSADAMYDIRRCLRWFATYTVPDFYNLYPRWRSVASSQEEYNTTSNSLVVCENEPPILVPVFTDPKLNPQDDGYPLVVIESNLVGSSATKRRSWSDVCRSVNHKLVWSELCLPHRDSATIEMHRPHWEPQANVCRFQQMTNDLLTDWLSVVQFSRLRPVFVDASERDEFRKQEVQRIEQLIEYGWGELGPEQMHFIPPVTSPILDQLDSERLQLRGEPEPPQPCRSSSWYPFVLPLHQ